MQRGSPVFDLQSSFKRRGGSAATRGEATTESQIEPSPVFDTESMSVRLHVNSFSTSVENTLI
jgi:hypothetical protein